MVLNGDGKSQIVEEDSLETYTAKSKRFQVVLCNPPFGTKILEKRPEVLRRFSMGHEWKLDDDGLLVETEGIRKRQQTGILFTELCVRLAEPGGRVGIILPNGYLGNKSAEYLALREWLLRHTRVVRSGSVCLNNFPRYISGLRADCGRCRTGKGILRSLLHGWQRVQVLFSRREALQTAMRRALATGSDGLAEIANDDLLSIVLPCLGSTTARSRVLEQLMFLMDRDTRFGKAVQRVTKELRTYPTITLRKSHCSIV